MIMVHALGLGGNGWNTANNIAKAKKDGKEVAFGDKYEVMMGGPLTYGSVGHNWANAQNTNERYKSNVHQWRCLHSAIMHWPIV